MSATRGQVAPAQTETIDRAITDEEVQLLLALIALPTTTPLEGGSHGAIVEAQLRYAEHARELGLEVALHAAPPVELLDDPGVPSPVLEAAGDDRAGFLAAQPNLVLRLGGERPLESTIAINAHIDTVGGGPPARLEDKIVHGRGAVDMKGPAVAVLAAVRRALAARPSLPERTSVVIHCVAGEEGGAMGSYGTRHVLDAGFGGRLIVFAEPTRGRYFDSCTATMTAAIEVAGDGCTDDDPSAGHNATILLGYVAHQLARSLDEPVRRLGGKLCVGGVCTGSRHDRVYGAGRLLVNVAYPDVAAGDLLATATEDALASALASFAAESADVSVARRTAADATQICTLKWLKRGLPALANRDPHWEAVLADTGIERVDDPAEAFTCDAIWGGHPGSYSIVMGPGDLVRDGAHTDRERVSLDDLGEYSETLARLLLAFDDDVRQRAC